MKEWTKQGNIFIDIEGKTQLIQKELVVRYLSDDRGKSLSITDENTGVMFQVPFSDILKEISGEEKA